jgi:DNA-binding transcriptional regulator YiaG
LPNVFLKNGYEVVETPYGQGVTIHDLDGLHLALGAAIVESTEPLDGSEFRFLRTELDLSQSGLADVLGCDEQTVARWEKGKSKQVQAQAERLLRLFYRQCRLGEKKFAPLLESLKALERTPTSQRKFVASERKSTWSARAQAV